MSWEKAVFGSRSNYIYEVFAIDTLYENQINQIWQAVL